MTVNRAEIKKLAEEWTKTMNIRAINSNAKVSELSGEISRKLRLRSRCFWCHVVEEFNGNETTDEKIMYAAVYYVSKRVNGDANFWPINRPEWRRCYAVESKGYISKVRADSAVESSPWNAGRGCTDDVLRRR
jgi:hypothetical protein